MTPLNLMHKKGFKTLIGTLIREIKFVEPVNSVAFLNEKADLIVGHSGNLSRLYAVDYMDKSANVPAEEFEEYLASEKAVDEKWFKKIS